MGNALRSVGHDVVWASDGRSDATRSRAEGLRDVGTVAEVARAAEVVLSICPPHAALDVARSVDGFGGTYVDANAISPARSREVAALHGRFVDGGIVGGPPRAAGDTRLYLSGTGADEIAALFAGSVVDARVVADASALKMVYAAWSKGTAALLLAIRDVARHYGVVGRARGRVARVAAGARRAARCRGAVGRHEGLALDRRDGGDRRHVRRGRRAGGLPSRGSRGLPVVITGRGLAKRYGDRRVFRGVDVELADGGFLLVTGPNGSGKTTLLRVLAGLAAPDGGELQLPARGTIGYLGHEPLVYRELTPLENLTLFGRLYRLPERGRARRDAARAVRALGRAPRPRLDVLARHAAAARALPRAAARPAAAPARRAVQRARRRRRGAARRRARRASAPSSSRRTSRSASSGTRPQRLAFA